MPENADTAHDVEEEVGGDLLVLPLGEFEQRLRQGRRRERDQVLHRHRRTAPAAAQKRITKVQGGGWVQVWGGG